MADPDISPGKLSSIVTLTSGPIRRAQTAKNVAGWVLAVCTHRIVAVLLPDLGEVTKEPSRKGLPGADGATVRVARDAGLIGLQVGELSSSTFDFHSLFLFVSTPRGIATALSVSQPMARAMRCRRVLAGSTNRYSKAAPRQSNPRGGCSRWQRVLKLERRLSHEGMVSVSGNLYSVPDTTRRRVLDVHVFADEIRIFEDGALIATHVPLEGRDQEHLDPAHRKALPPRHRRRVDGDRVIRRTGDQVAGRSLDFYDAVARHLAGQGGAAR